MRVVRPGMVVGPQQRYMQLNQLKWAGWVRYDRRRTDPRLLWTRRALLSPQPLSLRLQLNSASWRTCFYTMPADHLPPRVDFQHSGTRTP